VLATGLVLKMAEFSDALIFHLAEYYPAGGFVRMVNSAFRESAAAVYTWDPAMPLL
jgi:hypothetical protein